MKNYIINHCLAMIQKNYPQYDETRLAEIKYGLLSIYLLITKLVVILALALALNLLKEVLIFMLIYNIIRTPSFGLHATKSWICLLTSTIIFIGVPYLCLILEIPILMRGVVGAITVIRIFQNAPADTHKRPIVNPKRRLVYKTLSTMIAIGYAFCSLIVDDPFWQNAFLFASVVQCFIISPYVYHFFKLPYNNYKRYQVATSN